MNRHRYPGSPFAELNYHDDPTINYIIADDQLCRAMKEMAKPQFRRHRRIGGEWQPGLNAVEDLMAFWRGVRARCNDDGALIELTEGEAARREELRAQVAAAYPQKRSERRGEPDGQAELINIITVGKTQADPDG